MADLVVLDIDLEVVQQMLAVLDSQLWLINQHKHAYPDLKAPAYSGLTQFHAVCGGRAVLH